MLRRYFSDKGRHAAFVTALNACCPGLGDDSIKFFDRWYPAIRLDTYICCVSEHDKTEDQLGRLSMWRAFGQYGTARAALVMNVPQLGAAAGLSLSLYPVEYIGDGELGNRLDHTIRDINANVTFLQSFDRNRLLAEVFIMLASYAVCIKHVGFKEELEWRVIYVPSYRSSNLIETEIVSVAGIPQTVHKIPLRDDPAHDVVGVGIPSLIERIIIGPTVYPAPISMAFSTALGKAGVQQPERRVIVSNIPIRT
jgi:hypothetical protein